jgi:hypothetical protein
VRRLPYLFSVAPPGYSAGVSAALTPPSREGWPETHSLLDQAWERYLAATEAVLARQPYLLGERFSVADASAYGQLGMNLTDPGAADKMRALAPATFAWLGAIRDRRHVGSRGSLAPAPHLAPLLEIVMLTFPPLMRQNEAAYESARDHGETLFNEPAFNRGRALYDGELLGHRFRCVAKTFQVRVWRDVRAAWKELPAPEREELKRWLPGWEQFEAGKSESEKGKG